VPRGALPPARGVAFRWCALTLGEKVQDHVCDGLGIVGDRVGFHQHKEQREAEPENQRPDGQEAKGPLLQPPRVSINREEIN